MTVTFNTIYNLASFPSYFYDEGVYIARALAFAQWGELYESSTYIDHPPLGWLILSSLFQIIDFPNSLVNPSIAPDLKGVDIQALFLIPRLLVVPFIVTSAVLVYRISYIFYNGNRHYALLSLVSYSLIPAMWPFRGVLIYTIMVTFLLLSLYILLLRQTANRSSLPAYDSAARQPRKNGLQLHVWIFISGSLFGAALLVKLTAIFFLPALIVFVLFVNSKQSKNVNFELNNKPLRSNTHNQDGDDLVVRPALALVNFRNSLLRMAVWGVPIALVTLCWVLLIAYFGYQLEALIQTQLWQISRPSSLPFGIVIPLLFVVCPFGFVVGFYGLARSLIDKGTRKWSSLVIPYLIFLLRGGIINFQHIIPLAPMFILFTGRHLHLILCWLARLFSRDRRMTSIKSPGADSNLIVVRIVPFLMVLSIAITILLASFDAAEPDREAIQYLILELPQNATLVADPQYKWIINHYRPDVFVTDYFTLNFTTPVPNNLFLAERPTIGDYEKGYNQSYVIFDKSCLIKQFRNDPSVSYHPFNFFTEEQRWWNVNLRHYAHENACNDNETVPNFG